MNAPTTIPPRPKTKTWEVGDLVSIGSARWAIRTITKKAVELELMNNPNAAIWWNTTLANLPKKVTA